MNSYIAEIIVDFFELSLFLVGLYYVVVGVFSLFNKRDIPKGEVSEHSFAVIIPAHNEELVIGQLIKSILSADYPKEKLGIFVVADSCEDNTAYIAEGLGVNVIKKSSNLSNKSSAILAAVQYICKRREEYDYAAVIDADNIVRHDFFRNMNYMFACGYRVVQGNVEAKNPNQNWLTAAYSVWHSLETRLGKISCHNLGMSSKISGTGYCAEFDIFKMLPPSGDCLAEDLEYTARFALNNIKVGFARGAVVYDEKPRTLRCSLRQRIRWAQGVVDVQGRYGFTLLRHGKITDWLSLYGDFLGIFTYALFCVISFFSTVSIIYDYDFSLCGLWTNLPCYIALNIYLGIGFLTALIGLVLDKKLTRYNVFNLFGFLIYFITWIPAGLIGMLSHNKKEWYHTGHVG